VYVARLFDKDQSIARPVDLPLPFSSDNPPPSVRVTVILIILQPITDISCWLVFQDLYPDCKVDRSCPMRMIMDRKSPLVMMLKVRERLQLRHSLPIRAGPA
jgi:hypothetical protein